MLKYFAVKDSGLPEAELKAKFETRNWPHVLVQRSPALQRAQTTKTTALRITADGG
jgi:hypothetical protein